MDFYAIEVGYDSSIQSNLCQLPLSIANRLLDSGIPTQDFVVKVQEHYLGWNGLTSAKLSINPTLANVYKLRDSQRVDVTVLTKIKAASTVWVDPVTEDDWEIIEQNAGFLEENILKQTRCVSLGQKFLVYVRSNVFALCNVTQVKPNIPVARLDNDTEVAIRPRERRKARKQTAVGGSNGSAARILLRGVPVEGDSFSVAVDYDEVINDLGGAQYVYVSVLPGPDTEKAMELETITPSKRVVAKLVHCKGLCRHVDVSTAVQQALGSFSVGSVVQLEKVESSPLETNTAIVHPFVIDSGNLTLNSKQEPVSLAYDVYTNHMLLPRSENLPLGGVLVLKGKRDAYALNVKEFTMGEPVLCPESQLPCEIRHKEHLETAIGVDSTVEKLHKKLLLSSGCLVHGFQGSGKTLVARTALAKLEGYHKLMISCEDIHETFSALQSKIQAWFQEASWYAPSVILLDNLDKIFPSSTDESQPQQNEESNRLTEYFIHQFNTFAVRRSISLCITARSRDSLNSLLFTNHIITDIFHLMTPNKDLRSSLLEAYMADLKLTTSYDLADMTMETEGYLPSDLKLLVNKLYHESLTSGTNELDEETFSRAIEGFTPSSLRGVKLQKSSTNWQDIGGLGDAKNLLLETLEWPTKYAPIFKSCPLRLRSGVLLYGYPGCGKTLLASAVAGQCGLNFISVKGPEILNKYIGASEQSVRELFERAQAAKPCILFFDEFDSIAPKRGHDSTGVTDRVVNQMLTQMDGAEGLDGVYVLAATSRPDLIDGALLRPGRLDKSVICDLPNEQDRFEILQAVTRKMTLDPAIDLMEVSKGIDGFSGADIQGLCYNAYLKGVHVKLDKLEGPAVTSNKVDFFESGGSNKSFTRKVENLFTKPTTSKQNEKVDVIITQEHFEQAISETKPSISMKEKMKLASIYEKFVSGRDGKLPNGEASNEIGGRTTLM